MGYGQAKLHGCQSARQRRVGVTVDQYPIRFLRQHHFFDSHQHPAGLLAMASRADVEIHIGRGDRQLLEKDSRHAGVVVLTGMHQHLAVSLAKHPTDRRRFDELRPGAYDGEYFHEGGGWRVEGGGWRDQKTATFWSLHPPPSTLYCLAVELGNRADDFLLLRLGNLRIHRQRDHLMGGGFGVWQGAFAFAQVGVETLQVKRQRVIDHRADARVV